ncbi:MAG: hypothetical protein NT169_25800 [Chloroflexi bacterium]|nr:hypothetical protein [Chloroflexota bacterium]
MTEERISILLKEYEVSQAFSTQMGNQVWQTASIFIALSLAGIAFLGQSSAHSWSRLGLIAIIALAAVSILTFWARILRRWTSFDGITQYRMREIERELGMWKNRYIDYMDLHMRGVSQAEDGDLDAISRDQMKRLVQKNRHYYSFKSGGTAVTWIRRVLVFVWIAIFVEEVIFTLLHYIFPGLIP